MTWFKIGVLKMKRATSLLTRVAAFLVASAMAWSPGHTQEFEKNILTGGPTGTYIQFGRNIAQVAARCGLTLNVRESAGSLENFLGVRKRARTQFGIVQSDVLEYLSTFAADDPDIARAIFGVRIAFPLYNEEVHVLAKRDIASFADLAGRRVAIGVEDSGTFLTASLTLDLAGVVPAERLTINAEEFAAGALARRYRRILLRRRRPDAHLPGRQYRRNALSSAADFRPGIADSLRCGRNTCRVLPVPA